MLVRSLEEVDWEDDGLGITLRRVDINTDLMSRAQEPV